MAGKKTFQKQNLISENTLLDPGFRAHQIIFVKFDGIVNF